MTGALFTLLISFTAYEMPCCMSGPGRIPTVPPCSYYDLDGDGDVDLRDWSMAQNAIEGIG